MTHKTTITHAPSGLLPGHPQEYCLGTPRSTAWAPPGVLLVELLLRGDVHPASPNLSSDRPVRSRGLRLDAT